jgi:hypothetical protein
MIDLIGAVISKVPREIRSEDGAYYTSRIIVTKDGKSYEIQADQIGHDLEIDDYLPS